MTTAWWWMSAGRGRRRCWSRSRWRAAIRCRLISCWTSFGPGRNSPGGTGCRGLSPGCARCWAASASSPGPGVTPSRCPRAPWTLTGSRIWRRGAVQRCAVRTRPRLAAVEGRVEADLMLGGHGELAGELEALVRAHPLRERLWGQLMVALYRSGRQGDALGAYQRARTVLAGELGVDPGLELRTLEAAVLAQDVALDAPPIAPAEVNDRRSGNLPAAPSELIGR